MSVNYGIRANSLLAALKDGASVNQAAMEQIKFTLPKVLSVVCFSHMLDNVGSHFQIRHFGNLATYGFACSVTPIKRSFYGRSRQAANQS